MKLKKMLTYVIPAVLFIVIVVSVIIKPDQMLSMLMSKSQDKVVASTSQYSTSDFAFELEAETEDQISSNKETGSSTMASNPNISNKTINNESAQSTASKGKNSSTNISSANLRESETESNKILKQDGLTFTFHKVTATKKIGAYSKSKINFWGEKTDKSGNLIGQESYVFLRLTVKNENASSRECYLNGLSLRPFIENRPAPFSIEMRFFEQGISPDAKEFFLYTFQSREEKTFDLGYIVEDDMLAKYPSFCFLINMRGVSPIDDTVKIIPVKLK